MTVSTRALCRSRSAKFAGLLAILGFLAFQTTGQTSHERSIGSDVDPTVRESVAYVTETVGVHGTADATQRLLIPQTETKRKPNLPVSVVNAAINASSESPTTKPPAALDELVAAEKGPDPAWRPFDHLPRQPRFLKNDKSEADRADVADNGHSEKFHWKPAILQSMLIQGFQISYALVIQEKTRRGLKGPFFRDYWESIKGVRGWTDGNKFFTNYIAHPMQGGMTGFIFVQNHDRAKKQKFGESKQYWKDRFKAFVWSAAWSTNWELGPISQSSIGNVGLYGHQGYVDLVVTPTVGTGWLLTEEALDRYVIRHLETRGPGIKKLVRTFLNPMRSVANLLRFKEPWYRDRPFGH
ncbi:MAG: hypothetical protein ABL984_08425 [Pyrinomonadaceae bacterium]